LLDTKVDKLEISNILAGFETNMIAAFRTGMATGKAANIAGTCNQLGTTTTTGL